MAPIVHHAAVATSAADLREDNATALASCSATDTASPDRSSLPCNNNSKGGVSGCILDGDPIVDGSVVVTSGAPKKSPSSAAEAALKAVSLTSAIPSAARRKGRKDRPRATAAAAAANPPSGADENGIFDDSLLEFLVDDAARLSAPACRLEAPEPGPEERGYVMRAPIFIWKI